MRGRLSIVRRCEWMRGEGVGCREDGSGFVVGCVLLLVFFFFCLRLDLLFDFDFCDFEN